MRLPRPIDAATQARVSREGRRCRNPLSLQSPSVTSATLFIRARGAGCFLPPPRLEHSVLDTDSDPSRRGGHRLVMSVAPDRAATATIAVVTARSREEALGKSE